MFWLWLLYQPTAALSGSGVSALAILDRAGATILDRAGATVNTR